MLFCLVAYHSHFKLCSPLACAQLTLHLNWRGEMRLKALHFWRCLTASWWCVQGLQQSRSNHHFESDDSLSSQNVESCKRCHHDSDALKTCVSAASDNEQQTAVHEPDTLQCNSDCEPEHMAVDLSTVDDLKQSNHDFQSDVAIDVTSASHISTTSKQCHLVECTMLISDESDDVVSLQLCCFGFKDSEPRDQTIVLKGVTVCVFIFYQEF